MSGDITDFWIHTVTVQTFTGTGARGETFAAVSAPIACLIEDGRRLVRNATGQEVISETTVYTDLAQAAVFATDSKVTVNGRVARVITVKQRDLGALAAEVTHLEVVLT